MEFLAAGQRRPAGVAGFILLGQRECLILSFCPSRDNGTVTALYSNSALLVSYGVEVQGSEAQMFPADRRGNGHFSVTSPVQKVQNKQNDSRSDKNI